MPASRMPCAGTLPAIPIRWSAGVSRPALTHQSNWKHTLFGEAAVGLDAEVAETVDGEKAHSRVYSCLCCAQAVVNS